MSSFRRIACVIIKQIAAEQNAVLVEEKALAVLGDMVSGIGVI